MEEVLGVVVLGRAARNGANIKNRQPLGQMYVQAEKVLDEEMQQIIREELNVKQIRFVTDTGDFVSYSFKPQLKTVGPKYGKQLGEIRQALADLDGSAAKAQLDADGKLTLSLSGGEVELTAEDLLIDVVQKEGFYTVSDHGVTVALDCTLTDALIEEGTVREIISKIQNMRKEKDAGFEVTDHITVSFTDADEALAKTIRDNEAQIAAEVLADRVCYDSPVGAPKAWNINGHPVTIGIAK